jgi:hypothetical protein
VKRTSKISAQPTAAEDISTVHITHTGRLRLRLDRRDDNSQFPNQSNSLTKGGAEGRTIAQEAESYLPAPPARSGLPVLCVSVNRRE